MNENYAIKNKIKMLRFEKTRLSKRSYKGSEGLSCQDMHNRLSVGGDSFTQPPVTVTAKAWVKILTPSVYAVFILLTLSGVQRYNKVIEFVTTKFSILGGMMEFLDVMQVFEILIPVGLALGVGIGLFGR